MKRGSSRTVQAIAWCSAFSAVLPACDSNLADENEPAPAMMTAECDSLTAAQLDGGRVTAAEHVATGQLEIENPGSFTPPVIKDLPAFCRVTMALTPAPESRIGVELWLPAADWNGRLLMIGNGGYSSSIAYTAMAEGIRDGYAMIATDTGHQGEDPAFAKEYPERIIDWAWRAVHESVTTGTTVLARAYGRSPRYRYFAGCSTGGQQALMTAQRFPDDFDGIVAGAPGHNRTHLNAGFLWQFLVNHEREPPHAVILPAEKLQLINDAVLAKCGTVNGGYVGGLAGDLWLNDPFHCDFDPAQLQCKGDSDVGCLTGREINAARAIYAGPSNPRTGERIYFGQLPGSEVAGGPPNLPGWSLYWSDPLSPDKPARASFWKYWAFESEDWNWWQFEFDADMRTTDDRLAATINAMDANLSAFRRSGGKLLHYHGMSDAVVPATDSIDYFERVRTELGGDVSDFYRLFLAPGMYHCGGGPGANHFEPLEALVQWVEAGTAPDQIVARRYSGADGDAGIEFERPLCPYPQRAIYDGIGEKTAAASFGCRTTVASWKLPKLGAEYRR